MNSDGLCDNLADNDMVSRITKSIRQICLHGTGLQIRPSHVSSYSLFYVGRDRRPYVVSFRRMANISVSQFPV